MHLHTGTNYCQNVSSPTSGASFSLWIPCMAMDIPCKLCLSVVHDGVSVSPNILQTVTVLVYLPTIPSLHSKHAA